MKAKKISEVAQEYGVTYRTIWNWVQKGYLSSKTMPSGTILIIENENSKIEKTAIYCRVSSSENKKNLESQKDRVYNYCLSRGYKIEKIITEIGSGVNDTRKKWISLLKDESITKIVVEHKDRFTRFGFNAIETLLNNNNRSIEVINSNEDIEKDILQDFISIITSFCARIYGNRRSKRKTEKIVEELNCNG